MPDIKIEKDVPLPVSSNIPALPLADMSVGESFSLTVRNDTERSAVRQRLSRYQRSNPPVLFSMRIESDNTYRIFRMPDKEQ